MPAGVYLGAVPALSAQVGTIADRFFGAPSQALTVAGITGTNGKTTCAWLLAQALTHCRRPAAYIGTLGYGRPPQVSATLHTTSDAVTLHRQLARLRELGAECVCMEVSSHALDQSRVNGVRFHTAVFTNLTRDHLDYHGTMEAYGAAKARLFAWPHLALRVINLDDPFGAALAAPSRCAADCDAAHHAGRAAGRGALRARRARDARSRAAWSSRSSPAGARHSSRCAWWASSTSTTCSRCSRCCSPGRSRCAMRCARSARSRAASGRMEMFGGRGRTPLAIVDYAHTPDALANALTAARLHCRGALRVVFGCGGDRDAGKRPLMGRIAAELADDVIVTDDNPRSEDPARIVADILAGMSTATPHVVEHDRALAIRLALERSGADDVVLIAGKGHEDYQIVGAERRAFQDQTVVQPRAGAAARHEAHARRVRAPVRRPPGRRRCRLYRRGDRLAHARPRAAVRRACAGRSSTATISWPRRTPPGPPARW